MFRRKDTHIDEGMWESKQSKRFLFSTGSKKEINFIISLFLFHHTALICAHITPGKRYSREVRWPNQVLSSKVTDDQLKHAYRNIFINKFISLTHIIRNNSHLPFYQKGLWTCGIYSYIYWWATGSCANRVNKSIRKRNVD